MRKSFKQKEKKMSHNRKSTLIRFASVLMLLFTMFAIPQPASACSCVMPGSPTMEFSQSPAVFSGKVIDITDKFNPAVSFIENIAMALGFDPFIFYTDRFWGNRVTFSVIDSWKLVDTTSVQVSTGNGGGDCGYGFSMGSDYLVYGYDDPSEPGIHLGTSICSRTTDLATAAEDLAFLQSMPTIPLTQSLPSAGQMGPPIILAIFLLLSTLILFVWWRKRQQPG
jgi:LPXTG-motif cell wall-anchored protein